jgi:hypothetical protein
MDEEWEMLAMIWGKQEREVEHLRTRFNGHNIDIQS